MAIKKIDIKKKVDGVSTIVFPTTTSDIVYADDNKTITLKSQIDGLITKLEGVDTVKGAIDALKTELLSGGNGDKLKEIHDKLLEIDTWMKGDGANVTKITGNVTKIEQINETLNNSSTGVIARLSKTEAFETRINAVEESLNKETNGVIARLGKAEDEIRNLKTSVGTSISIVKHDFEESNMEEGSLYFVEIS